MYSTEYGNGLDEYVGWVVGRWVGWCDDDPLHFAVLECRISFLPVRVQGVPSGLVLLSRGHGVDEGVSLSSLESILSGRDNCSPEPFRHSCVLLQSWYTCRGRRPS